MTVLLRNPGPDVVFYILSLPDASSADTRTYSVRVNGDTVGPTSVDLTETDVVLQFAPDTDVQITVETVDGSDTQTETLAFTVESGVVRYYYFGVA